MVKRILENERYLGMDGYPRLVTDEEFLAVRLRRREQNTYAPCPSEIIPIRNKAVCALCGEKMTRDTKSHGRPRWRCKNPECGGSVYLDDSIILERVMQKLKVLAHSPEHIQLPKAAPVSTDALRIENASHKKSVEKNASPNLFFQKHKQNSFVAHFLESLGW